ncbi:hypothetical protein [Prochlorococcus marinus]|uniref:hypothetical protein n=1 Tax=Prochlorococcus marinus TaxID=1219 RepID=UPI001AD9EC91|nr:hypothetical protein [Prochlorococcus marinus]MBO8219380.1 hypothetical protein [Prochlorococcus marinus CUG1416]MBW3051761.1 hypothetical protein [Prochlorococcus marinus str. MU1416]
MSDFIDQELEAFPIPEEAIILDEELNLSVRELIILAMEKYIKEKNLNLQLGPALALTDPSRSIILNKFDIQIITSELIADEAKISLKNSKIEGKGPQIILAAQVEEDSKIVYFKGVLTSEEFKGIINKKDMRKDEFNISLDSFNGGIDRLFRLVRLLDTEALPRLNLLSKSNSEIWIQLKKKIKFGSFIAIGAISTILIGPELLRPKLMGSIATLTPQSFEVNSFTRSSSEKKSICLLTPTVVRGEDNILSAEIKVDKPTIYSLKPLNEVKIIKDNKILWRKIATSSKKIEGPINWPLDPIKRGDEFKLSLRADGASLGSELNINLITYSKEKLNDLDEIVSKLGDSKNTWIKSINENIKIDKDTGLTLLFSDKAPASSELQKVKSDLSIEDRCD